MIEHVTQTDEFLYHYTTVDKALNYILKSRMLRFGAYANSNDPKETKIWRDECEWRWVVFASSDQDLYVAFGNALTGIMFGEDTSERRFRT